MKALILCALLAVSSAQLFGWWNGQNSDRHNGYIFEYHSRSHVLLVRDRHNCYIIDANQDVAKNFENKDTREAVEDDIIKHITEKTDLHKEHKWEALTHHHDALAAAECITKTIYELTYQLPQ